MVRIAAGFWAATVQLVAASAAYASTSQAVLSSQSIFADSLPGDGLPHVHLSGASMLMDGQGIAAASPETVIRQASKGHVRITHEDFAGLQLRVKLVAEKQQERVINEHDDGEGFCDPTVTSWSGFLDLSDGKSLFFLFFESRSNPETDPLILWTNGGPGCASSGTGWLQELGPCLIKDTQGKGSSGPPSNGTRFNPYSWNSRANLIIIDQPANVGFSRSRYGVEVGDTPTASVDIDRFLRVFLSTFKRFQKNDLVLAAESYGGTYIPEFAQRIFDENAKRERAARKAGRPVDPSHLLNLKKLSIGNGIFDRTKQFPMLYDLTCTRSGGHYPVLPIDTCRRMSAFKKKCSAWLTEACRQEGRDTNDCQAALEICASELATPYRETGLNVYNMREECLGGPEDGCYPISADIRAYLDRNDVRAILGVPSVKETGHFKGCSARVAQLFRDTNDGAGDTTELVAALLERGIEILLYAGTDDWICNWLGNEAWIKDLDWTNSADFHNAKKYEWKVDGKAAGSVRSGGNLTWATVWGAGHMVPYDQPENALALLTRFLDGESL